MTVRYSLLQTYSLICSDLAFRGDLEPKRGWIRDLVLLTEPGVACVIRYRLQCLFYSNGFVLLGRTLKFLNLIFYGVDLHQRARIGGGFVILHPVCIFITDDVTIGERCIVYHHTTLARSPYLEPGREPGPLVVGNDVTFGMGSCAYGNIGIGDGCSVGANTVVDRSCAPHSYLIGVPARIVSDPTSPKAEA